jgi:hypothetical protein
LKLADKKELRLAVHVIAGKCSEEECIFFRAVLVAQGKEVLLNALKDPDSLADVEGIRVFRSLSLFLAIE